MANPHDRLVKFVLGQPAHAGAYLRRFLPTALVEGLDLDGVVIHAASFVDAQLEARETDLLLEAPVRGAGEDGPRAAALVYVLLEHQSRPDPGMTRRLYRYLDRVWARWEEEHPRATRLPVIVPMVLYHGQARWRAPRRLHDALAWPPGARASTGGAVPDFEFVLVDLARVADDALGADAVALGLKLLKWTRRADFLRHVPTFAAAFDRLGVEPSSLRLLTAFVHDVLEVRDHEDGEEFVRLVGQSTGPATGAIAMTAAEHLRELGRQEGRQEGGQEGRHEGRQEGRHLAVTELLTQVLQRRFGPLPTRAQDLIAGGHPNELEAWFARALDAPTLHDVFGAAWDGPRG